MPCRRKIESVFPAFPYQGAVTCAEGNPWSAEIDEDLDLSRALKGRAWPSLPADFIELHALDLPLLTPSAFAAFLPAWLLRVLKDMNGDNVVREYVVYLSRLTNPKPIGRFAHARSEALFQNPADATRSPLMIWICPKVPCRAVCS